MSFRYVDEIAGNLFNNQQCRRICYLIIYIEKQFLPGGEPIMWLTPCSKL